MRIGALAAVAVLVLAACGDDDDGGASASLPEAPSSTGDGEFADATDDVVVSYAEVGGFTTRAFAVQSLPQIVITGDGRVLTPGATVAVFPGPLLPPVFERSITDDGIQAVLAAADEAGLFADVDYSSEAADFVADATTATVVVSADGATWEHSAYALGIGGGPGGGDETPARAALQGFVDQLGDLETLVGPEALGPEEPYAPTEYRVVAFPVDDPDAMAGDGLEATIVEWPADAPVRLADPRFADGGCVLVPAEAVGGPFADANQLTFFDDDGVIYEVLPTPMMPGLSCG